LYSITYKNKLKHGKSLKDFKIWLKSFWTIQQTWGAQTVHFWSGEEGEDDIVFCEYLVQDIRRWNRQAMRFAASSFIRDLGQIAETNRITVSKIEDPRSRIKDDRPSVADSRKWPPSN